MAFRLIRNDITRVCADVIVNTANPEVNIGRGVDFAIYRAAGEDDLLEARKKIGNLEPGEMGVTDAFKLNAKYIFHVCSPVWRGGGYGEARCLRKCYDIALCRAAELGCDSIAFPLMAAGSNEFPRELVLQTAVDAFTEFLEKNEMEILLVVFGFGSLRATSRLGLEVRSYISDNEVKEVLTNEYGTLNYRTDSPRERLLSDRNSASLNMPEKAEETYNYNYEMPDALESKLKNIYSKSFSEYLQSLINKKGLKNSEVYAAANISKQYFSKLLKGQVNPSKDKMLALAVGLRLNLDEAIDFLGIAGYAFSPISQTDTIVKFFINRKDYNVIKIDMILFEFGLETLS